MCVVEVVVIGKGGEVYCDYLEFVEVVGDVFWFFVCV